MADTSSCCVLIKGLSHDATEQDLMKCLDKQNLSVSKVHSHTESRTDKRWVVLFSSSKAARKCIRQGSWKVNLPSGEITVTPDYCSECIVPDDWVEKHEDSDEESLDGSWIKVENPASKQLPALSGSVFSYSSEEPSVRPVCGAVDQTAEYDTQGKLLQLAAIDDSVEHFSEEIDHFAQFSQDKPLSEKMRTEEATGGKENHTDSDPDKSHASKESPDLPGSFYSCSVEEPNVMLAHGADGQNANVYTQQNHLHMAAEDDTGENFPKAVNQHARFPQDRPQSEEVRPKDSDGEKENSTDSNPDEMCQVAYVQGMSSQSELLIPESPKMIDDSTDYPPLKSGSIAMGTARLKYTTDTSHTDSHKDVIKHRDHDKIQTKTTYQKQGPIALTSRRGPQSLVTPSVKEEVCKQDRDSQENKECGHEKRYLPHIGSKENVASDEDEEGQTNVCHSQYHPSPDIEDLDYAMSELNIKDEHVNRQPQKENLTTEKHDVARSHENPSVHNERPLEPLKTYVMDKTIKTEVLQPCSGISAQGSTMPEPQPIIEGYPLNLTMPQPSQGLPSQDMTMTTSYMTMPQPYAEASFEGLTVSQPNTDNQLPNMEMPQPITGLPIQSMHITPVTSLPVNSPYIAGQVYSFVATGQTTVSGGTGNYMVPPGYAGHNLYNSWQTMPSISGRPQMNYGPYGWLHQSPPFTQQHVPATFSQPSYPTSQASFMYSMQSLRPPFGCPPTQGGFSGLMGPRDNAGQMASVSQTGPMQEDLGCVNKTRRPQTTTNAEIIQQKNTSDRFERVTVEQDLEIMKRDESELNEDRPQSQLYPKLGKNQFQFNKDSLENKGHPDRVNLIDSQRISHDHRHVLEGFESDKEAASNAHMDYAVKDAEKIESKPQKENVQTQRMIRVMGFTKSISQDALEMFFENKKRCGGGEIENLEWGRNKREVFITFKDPSVVQSVLEKQKSKPFHLEQLKLTVEEYVPPPPDPLRLFLTNLSPKVTKELLILYLESRCNATPAKIVFGRVPGTALVTFSEPPDVELLLKKAKERPLEGQNIQVVRVPVTSSIQLSGLPLSTTRDTIELYFENAKRSGGGPVTDVKHTKEKHSCIISFKHSEDAERVCMRQHTIDKKEIQVCLYYECLDDVLDEEEFSDIIHETEDTADELKLPDPVKLNNWNPQILRFLIKNTKHRNIFEKNLSDVNGVAKWPSSAEGYVIIECTVKVGDKNASSLLKDWTTRVINEVNKFAAGIEVAEFNLIQTAWPRVLEGLQTVTIDNPEDVGVFVDEEKHNIAVAGPRAIVEELKNTIKQMIVMVEAQIALEKNTVRKTQKLKTFEIALLRMSHFNQDIKKMHPELQFDLDQKERMAIFVGQADIVQKVMVQMHEKLNSFVSRSMQISKAAKDLLFAQETRKYIKQKMISQKIVGVWDVVRHDEVLMYGQDEKEVGRAIQLVKACLIENKIPLDEAMAQAIQGQQWSQLVQSILKKHTGKCAIEPDIKGILVVAVDDIFQDVFGEIKVYLEKHSVEELFLALDPTRVKFIGRYKKEDIKALEKKFESSHVKLSIIDYGDQQGIKINGTRDVCSRVKTDLAKMANTVITKEHRMVSYKEGLKEFLQGYKVRNQLSTIENRLKCFMVMKDLGTSSSLQQEGASGGYSRGNDDSSSQNYMRMEWQSSPEVAGSCIDAEKIKITLIQGELAKQRVDVIVNSCSQYLDLKIGAISKTILEYGGDRIQRECLQQYPNGIDPGKVVVTSGGQLSCRKVYHGCLSGYEFGKGMELLKSLICTCLHEADKSNFQSMAFPALGTGNLGFPAEEVVKLMVECIQTFGKLKPYSSLRDIALVIYPSDTNIIKAFTTVLGGTTVPSASTRRSASSSSNISTGASGGYSRGNDDSSSQNYMRMEWQSSPEVAGSCIDAGKIKITLVQGELAKQRVDVIVNSCSQNLDLKTGAISKTILEYGGDRIQRECLQKYPNGIDPGNIVATSGGMLSCRRVYHCCLSGYEFGKGMELMKSLIFNCLVKADESVFQSMAFPALGTGNLGFPAEEVAKLMVECIHTFGKSKPYSSLRDIALVVYPSDTNIIKAFTTVLGGTTVPSTSTRSASSSSNISTVSGKYRCTLPHSVVLEIDQGDITKETTNVIVNSVLSDLDLSQGEVSKAILKAGGISIQQECRNQDQDFKKYGYIVTTSGTLPCRRIIHMAAQDDDHRWKEMIRKVLCAADQSKSWSISFPALGTGGKGLSPENIAQAMYSACTEFAKSQPFYLKKIRVVLFQEAMLTRFVQAISALSSVQGESKVSRTPVGETKLRSILVFNITADSDYSVQAAVRELEGFLNKEFFM